MQTDDKGGQTAATDETSQDAAGKAWADIAYFGLGLFALVYLVVAIIGPAVGLDSRSAALEKPAIGAPFALGLPVLLIAFMTWLLKRRGVTWRALGLAKPRSAWRAALLVVGTFVGMAAIILLQPLIIRLTGNPPDISSFAPLQGSLPAYLLMLGVAWISAGVGEELAFRGFLLNRLTVGLGGLRAAPLVAMILQAILFGLVHYYQGPAGVITTGLVGLLFGAVYLYFGRNLVVLIAAHGLTDTISGTLLYLGAAG